ncbi:MAG: hypothetical protein Q4G51_01095 [Dermatophilus congolensis]|nr:hypothetical protein [Dermatophilus congolensis]
MSNTRVTVVAALAGAALLAGCSGQAAQQAPANDAQNATPAAQTQPGSGESAPDSGAAAVGVDPANPPTPIKTVTAPYSGEERITSITVDLLELKRSDKVLYGSFRVTNKGDYTGTKVLHQITGNVYWQPSLLDTTNLKEYEAIRQITSAANGRALANQPVYVHAGWAYPEGTTTVDIKINDELPIMQGVAVP